MPSWSPDGKQLVYCQYGPGVSIINADGSDPQPVDQQAWGARWCPKRNEIAYVANDNGANICIYDVAKKERRMLLERSYAQIRWPFQWSPDGAWICFWGTLGNGETEIAAVRAEGEAKGFKTLLSSAAMREIKELHAIAWGGTGKDILLSMKSDTDRTLKLYTLDFAGGKPPRLLPGEPANYVIYDVAYSPDGKKLVFSASPQSESGSAAPAKED